MRCPAILVIPVLALALGGCIRTIADVVTAPVKAGAKVADWVTVSQDERDRERGREIRRREERLGDLQEDYEDASEDCLDGSERACRRAVEIRREMDELIRRSRSNRKAARQQPVATGR